MSSGCGDVLSLEDLKTAKKHQLFEAEVITGRAGGTVSGESIDFATNQVTGQTQKTMPAILRDIGYIPAAFDFVTGGTIDVNERNVAVLWPLPSGDGDWYYWEGSLPKVIPANSTPSSTGGIVNGAWRPVGDISLRTYLATPDGASAIGDKVEGNLAETLHRVAASSGTSQALFPRFMNKISAYRHGYGGQTQYRVYGYGSSVGVGATLPDPSTQAPIAIFFEGLNKAINKGGVYPLSVQNNSVNGSSINDFLTTQWPATVATGVYPDLALFVYGMNDFPTALYNAGQTFGENGFKQRLKNAIRNIQEAGGDVVLTTTPHPFSDTFVWSMPSSVDQVWPNFVAKPVSDADIIPSAENSVVNINWNGVVIKAAVRFLRGNDAIRDIAVEMSCGLIDVEKYWFDAVAKYGEAALFNPGQNVHPNKFGHEQSYWAAIDDFFSNMGQNGWISPSASHPELFDVGGSGLYPQPRTADIALMANGVRTYAQALYDKFARLVHYFSHDGIERVVGYTNPNPTLSVPGYTCTHKRIVTRGGGTFNVGDVYDVPVQDRGVARVLMDAWSSNNNTLAQAESLLAVNRNGTVTINRTCTIDNTSINRLYTLTTTSGGLRFTFNTANTSIHMLIETFE